MLNVGCENLKSSEDASVDVVELSQSRDIINVEPKEDPDATENSSSFADTTSGNENTSGLSDAEVESQFFGDSDLAPPFDGFGSVFPIRKKKLTAHWRNFIHPLMWRCKWTEIKIKELESQASNYSRELAVNDRTKHMALDQIAVEQSGSKSLAFAHQSHRKSPMERRKRKRVEDASDIASYMSNHILFSERENKRADLDGVPAGENGVSDQHTNDQDDFGIHDECIFPKNNDKFLEHILRKIEVVHTRVHKLKAQLDSVMIKNGGRFSSSENLSQFVGCDNVQTSSVHSPTFSACNGDTALYAPAQQHMSDYDLSDYIMYDSAVSSFGQAIAIPDIIESTVGLLSSIDVTQQYPPGVGDSSEKIVDNMLVENEGTEVEGSTLKYNNNQSAEKNQDTENSVEEESDNAVVLASEPTAVAEQSILKPCLSSEIHFPKNKRKRGERKAASGNWSRQNPGEPDS